MSHCGSERRIGQAVDLGQDGVKLLDRPWLDFDDVGEVGCSLV